MAGLELVVLLGIALLACRVTAVRSGIAAPVLQLGAGVLLGLIPALREVQLPSQVVLLLFLPALLFWEALTSSLQEIRRNLRGIALMSTVLVILTAAATAAAAHAMGLPWGPAWVLGAAVAPTDATATGVVAKLLPRRNLAVLKAESLVNDGAALVIYGVAIGITAGEEHFSLPHVSWLFLQSYAGGVLAGGFAAWLGVQARKRVHEPLAASLIFMLIPFTGYLLAELLQASGVLAAVAAGLIISQTAPVVGSAEVREQINASWSMGTFLLNGALFILVGIEAQSAVRGLTSVSLTDALTMVVAVTAVLVAVRIAFLFTSAYLARALGRQARQRAPRMSARARIVSGLAGFRGAVSLAAALAVPATAGSGAPFPDRGVIIFVTFGVIVVTLLQGLILPAVVRWAQLPADSGPGDERRLAHETMFQAALTALPQAAAAAGAAPHIADRVRGEYEDYLATLDTGDDPDSAEYDRQNAALRLALLARQRAELVRLRGEHRIDDTVLRELQARIDLEELRLTRTELID
jgi:monovalent cation/hydrogen antiporter